MNQIRYNAFRLAGVSPVATSGRPNYAAQSRGNFRALLNPANLIFPRIPTMNNTLDKKDKADLQKYETVIEKGQKHFIEVGQALFAIKQRRLYRDEFGTFEEYCQERWGWGASRARQICGAVKYWEENKDKKAIENERQARKEIGEGQKSDSDNEKVTKKSVTSGNTLLGAPKSGSAVPCSEFIDRSTGVQHSAYTRSEPEKKPEPEIAVDKIGRPIPPGILDQWNRAHELGTKLRSIVSDLKCTLEKGIGNDEIFAELTNSVTAEARSIHFSLGQILPYAVCPKCQGMKTHTTCQVCRHRGYVSKTYWDGPTVGTDLRTLIEKQFNNHASV